MDSLFDKEYNSKRKEALLSIENNKKPSNTELGMLGLTTYFSNESLDDSLFDKILFAENELRRITHIQDKEFYFMPLQQDALDFITKNKNVLLLAPTSFGKTLIVKEYIYVKKPSTIAYIVPTNALAFELELSFKGNPSFDDYSIFDKENGVSSEQQQTQKLFFIGTQEKYLEIKDNLPPIDLFVIDEAYKLEEKTTQQRGYKLSKSFLDTIKSNAEKIILLCPVAEVVGFEEYGFVKFETRFNAVEKEYHKVPLESFYTTLNHHSRGEKTIFYCPTPAAINNCYSQIVNIVEPDRSFLHELKTDFHKEWSVVKYYEKGILIHHGQMPKYVQNKMIKMFLNNRNYSLLIGTNSISEGINTPTKNIFIHPEVRYEEHRMLMKNTIGRAGRLGNIPIGHIYSIEDIKQMEEQDAVIVLSVSQEDGSEELLESQNEERIEAISREYSISVELLKDLMKETKMSLRTLCNIFIVLMENQNYEDIGNLPKMANKVFEEYNMSWLDVYLIKGVLQSFYRDATGEEKNLNTFNSKIAYFKYKYRGGTVFSDSDIIDNYMRFIYSTLDNYLLVIANVAKRLMSFSTDWPFGINVKGTINSFLSKYYERIYGVIDFDTFSLGSQKIVQSLREYGVSLTDELISKGLIEKIETKLSVRYSTFDIVNALRDMSQNSQLYSKACQILLKKYF